MILIVPMSSKTFLNRVHEAVFKVDSLVNENALYYSRITRISPSTPDAIRSNGYPKDEQIIEYLDRINQNKALMDRERNLIDMCERYLSRMPNQKYASILRERYVLGKSWKRVAQSLHLSKSSVSSYMHIKALEQFEKVYSGILK